VYRISVSYKFDGKGGHGANLDHTHIFHFRCYRGSTGGKIRGAIRHWRIKKQIENITKAKGRKSRGLYHRAYSLAVGGQIEFTGRVAGKTYQYILGEAADLIFQMSAKWLLAVWEHLFGAFNCTSVPIYKRVGLCWHHRGKPLGNGHPLAAVAFVPRVGRKICQWHGIFQHPLGQSSFLCHWCRVLRVVKREKLQAHALVMLERTLKQELGTLAKSSPYSECQGARLFLGIELVNWPNGPFAAQTDYLANRIGDKIMVSL